MMAQKSLLIDLSVGRGGSFLLNLALSGNLRIRVIR